MLTIAIIKEKGRFSTGYLKHVRRGSKLIPVDPDQEWSIWKYEGLFYSIRENPDVINRMGGYVDKKFIKGEKILDER